MPCYQPQQSVLNPQVGQRQTACIRYISAPQRSQRTLSGWGARLVGIGDGISEGLRVSGMRGIIRQTRGIGKHEDSA